MNQIDERGGWTSASNAASDLLCPGRHQAQRGIPDEANADAEHGRAVHAAIATGNMAALDADQAETVEAVLAIEKSVGLQYFGEDAIKVKLFREGEGDVGRYWVAWSLPGADIHHSGKPDCVAIAVGMGRGLVIEYKSLFGDIQDVAENEQCRDNVVLVARHFHLKECGAVVIQPRVTHSPAVVNYTAVDLARAEAEMMARVLASNAPGAPRVPGERQCKYCKAGPSCPEYQKWSTALLPAKVGMASLIDVPVSEWTPEMRALFVDRVDVLQHWIDNTFRAIEKLAGEDPNAVAGYMMVPGTMQHPITDPGLVWERVSTLGVTPSQFMAAVKVLKGDLKEVLGKATTKKGAALAKVLEEVLQGATEDKPTKPRLERRLA